MGSLELRVFATYHQQEGLFKSSYDPQCDYASYYCDDIDTVIIQKIRKLTPNIKYDQNEKNFKSIKDYNDQEEDIVNEFPNQCITENVSPTRKNSKLKSDVPVTGMVEIDKMKNSYDINRNCNSCQDENSIRDLKIPYKQPDYEDYVHLSNRISSFTKYSELQQSAYSLAEAGFFYAGNGTESIIKCFHCGGSIKNWDPEDDPWIEHAHWFPRCVFLRQNKDKEFIDLVQQLSTNQQEECENDMQEPEMFEIEFGRRQNLECTNVEDQFNQVHGSKTEDVSINGKKGDNILCKICMNNDVSIVFLPCGHMASCAQCSPAMTNCPICRQNISGTFRAYLS